MNLKFCYLYRDAADYKAYHELVFINNNNVPLDTIKKVIQDNLLEGVWFLAEDWGLPRLLQDIDECRTVPGIYVNEFLGIEPTAVAMRPFQDVERLLNKIRNKKQKIGKLPARRQVRKL